MRKQQNAVHRRHCCQGLRHRQRPQGQDLPAERRGDQRAGARGLEALGRGPARTHGHVPQAARRRRRSRRPAGAGLRDGARSGQAHSRPAAFRRAAHRRHGAPQGQHRRDEDG